MTNEPTKISTLVIDDEELSRKRIINLLQSEPDFEVIGEASSGSEAIKQIIRKRPQLIFLDISLPDHDGFTVLETMPPNKRPLIIIVSGSENHALKAFEYEAFDYLLKPYRDQRFVESLQKIRQKITGESLNTISETTHEKGASDQDIIPIKTAGKISFINPEDIWYIEASGYYIEINALGKKHLLRQSMGRIINKLDDKKFIRIHRSKIINLDFLEEIVRSPNRDHLVKMKDGSLFKISKSYKKRFFERLNI